MINATLEVGSSTSISMRSSPWFLSSGCLHYEVQSANVLANTLAKQGFDRITPKEVFVLFVFWYMSPIAFFCFGCNLSTFFNVKMFLATFQ